MARLYRSDIRRLVKNNVRTFSHIDVLNACRHSALNQLTPYFFDTRYRALPKSTWESILEYSQIDTKQYRSEHYDCDNFAMALCGQVPTLFDVNGVGLVCDFSGKHAYNALLVSEDNNHLEIVGIEPQNDRWGVAQTRSSLYRADSGYILFC